MVQVKICMVLKFVNLLIFQKNLLMEPIHYEINITKNLCGTLSKKVKI